MSEQQKRLEGLVAGILNARELVINLGHKHGVRSGMKFAVLAKSPIEIRDPESNELLDTIDREKVVVEASEVRDKISICRTYRVNLVGGGPFGLSISRFAGLLGSASPPREVPETLSLHDSSMPPPLSEEESYVKVKDRVIQVTEKKTQRKES